MDVELDLRVAKALGHVERPCSFDVDEDITRFKDATWQCDICGYRGRVDKLWRWTDFAHNVYVPRYSTTIVEAFPLFEHLGPGWQLSQSDPGGWEDIYRWWCWLPTEYGGDGTVYAAATPTQAICKAFLREDGEIL